MTPFVWLPACRQSITGEAVPASSACDEYAETTEVGMRDGSVSLLDSECGSQDCATVSSEFVTLDPEDQPFTLLSKGDELHYAIPPGQPLDFTQEWDFYGRTYQIGMRTSTSLCTDLVVTEVDDDPWEGRVSADLRLTADIKITDDSHKVVGECPDESISISLATDPISEDLSGSPLGCGEDSSCAGSSFSVVQIFPIEEFEEIDCLRDPLKYSGAEYIGFELSFGVLNFPETDSGDVEEI